MQIISCVKKDYFINIFYLFISDKNEINKYCKGEWILQLDADETISDELMGSIHDIIEQNPTVEMYWLPRINTVEGLTSEHIQKWGWRINERGWIMWPDYQGRLYKNNERIKWFNRVHERLTGYDICSSFPTDENYAIIHNKSIERQEKQNNYYDTLMR